MEFLINFILITCFSIYLIYIYFFYKGLNKNKISDIIFEPYISIVIPARNEENNILRLLNSIKLQSYNKTKIEVIIIDDNSTDKTFESIEDFCRNNIEFKVFKNGNNNQNISPKVSALDYGISKSNNEIIFLTDADCIVQTKWIENTLKYFENDCAMVTGITLFENNKNNFLNAMQQLDYSSHNAICAGSLGNNLIVNANGTNLAIRKIALNEVGGIKSVENHFSGEDSFLAQKFRNTKWNIKFAIDKETIVYTMPINNWKDYFSQRIRWSAQTKYYPNELRLFLFCTGILHILLITKFIFLFSKLDILFFALVISKITADYIFLNTYFLKINIKIKLFKFVFAEIFHLPTTLYIAFKGYFTNYDWKK